MAPPEVDELTGPAATTSVGIHAERNKRKKELAKQRKAEEKTRQAAEKGLLEKLNSVNLGDVAITGESSSQGPTFLTITNVCTRVAHSKDGPLFEIKATPDGKGLGMFALRFIKNGTEILREDAILKGAKNWLCKEALYMVLPAHKKQAFDALYSRCNCGKTRCTETPLMKIFEVNSFDANEHNLTVDGAPQIYLTASRMNHDCIPNTARGYTEEQYIVFRAIRDILPGQEITTDYVGALGSTKYRQERTLKMWGFVCKCLSCIASRTFSIEFTRRVLAMSKVTTSGTKVVGKATSAELAKEREVITWFNARIGEIPGVAMNGRAITMGLVGALQRNSKRSEVEGIVDTQMLIYMRTLQEHHNKYDLSYQILWKFITDRGDYLVKTAEEVYDRLIALAD